jgi:O-antigen/teichoic acid export membrane protein
MVYVLGRRIGMTTVSEWIRVLRYWIANYGLLLIAQVSSAAAGLIFVNLLSVEQFALFAVCTALLQAIVAQSDLGTLAAVGYFYREHPSWDSFTKNCLPSITRLRITFFFLAGIVLTIFFIFSQAAKSVIGMRIVELLCLTIVSAWFGMITALQVVVLRVRGDVTASIGIELVAGFARLALAAVAVGLQLMSAEAALWTALISAILSFLVGRLSIREIPLALPGKRISHEQTKVLRYVLPLIPGSLYYTLQPSILVWLSMIYGNTQQIAEVGAISRIGQIISFLGVGLSLFVLPHMADLRDEKAFRRSYVFIWLILLSLASVVLHDTLTRLDFVIAWTKLREPRQRIGFGYSIVPSECWGQLCSHDRPD